MPIPDYQSLMLPMLNQLKDGSAKSLKDLLDALTQQFNLTEEECAERISSGHSTVMKNRVGWARTYLHKAGLVSIPQRAHCQITERGQYVLQSPPERITVRYLKQYPEFLEFVKPKQHSESNDSDSDDDAATPEEQLTQAYRALNNTLASDLLDQIKQTTPAFFEQLVVDLMIAMGYGGSREEAGQATQLSADGGIDRIIKEDPLGLDSIYLQAKRYTDIKIGRPEIQKFAGALQGFRAKKGVFITTSDYSKDATDFANQIDNKIILINGEQLAALMIKYNLGVSIKQTYELKSIDTDYFNEDSQ